MSASKGAAPPVQYSVPGIGVRGVAAPKGEAKAGGAASSPKAKAESPPPPPPPDTRTEHEKFLENLVRRTPWPPSTDAPPPPYPTTRARTHARMHAERGRPSRVGR